MSVIAPTAPPHSRHPDCNPIRQQLDRILQSPGFQSSPRMSRFLRFVVETSLSDEADQIKETTVAIAVFDRSPDFNPKTDPVVRNEARRLRAKLDAYYETEGKEDPVRISVPKGGYVSHFEIVEITPSIPTPALPPAKSNRSLWLLLIPAIALALWFALARPPHEPVIPVSITPLTSYTGREFQPAVSPDGHQVAFVWDGKDGNFDIYVKQLDGEPLRLTTNPAHDLYPAWSPDGQTIAFLRAGPDSVRLMSVSSLGGRERTIIELGLLDVGRWRSNALLMAGGPRPAWSPDGRELLFTKCLQESAACPLHAFDLASGRLRQVTESVHNVSDFYPAWSIDCKNLAFVRYVSNSSGDIYLADSPGQPSKRITSDFRDIRGLAWTPDHQIVFSSNRSGPYSLWKLNPETGAITAIHSSGEMAIEPSLSHDGKLLVFTDATINANIWQTDLKTNKTDRLIASSRQNHSAQFSPDGTHIVFASDRSGNWELWTAAADGTGPQQLTHFKAGVVGTPHWSPDGRYIAFDARPAGHSSVFVIPAAGGEPKPLQRNAFEERMPSWSPDGNWIYFNSNRTGRVEIWRAPAQGGAAESVIPHTGFDTHPDDKTLIYTDSLPGFWSVPLSGGQPTKLPGLEQIIPRRCWTWHPKGIFYYDQEALFFYAFATRKSKRLAAVDHQFMVDTPSLSVSPDGTKLLFARHDSTASDLMQLRGTF